MCRGLLVVSGLQLHLSQLPQRQRRFGIELQDLIECMMSVGEAIVLGGDQSAMQQILLFDLVFGVGQRR